MARPDIRFSLVCESSLDEDAEVPAFLRKELAPESASTAAAKSAATPTLRELTDLVMAHLIETGGKAAGLELRFGSLPLAGKLRLAIEEVSAMTQDPAMAWLLLAHWSNQQHEGAQNTTLGAALAPMLRGLDKSLLDAARRVFEQRLGADESAVVKSARAQRLGRFPLGMRI